MYWKKPRKYVVFKISKVLLRQQNSTMLVGINDFDFHFRQRLHRIYELSAYPRPLHSWLLVLMKCAC